MSRRAPQHSGFRIVIALITCAAFIPLPNIASLVSEAAQDQAVHGKGKPRPGKPEGNWPDLEDLKKESKVTRDEPPPIPSTMRSPKLSEKPWDGRRVGDPETTGRHLDQAVVVNRKLRRAHARSRVTPLPPPMEENTFIQNFFGLALREPDAGGWAYWENQVGPNGRENVRRGFDGFYLRNTNRRCGTFVEQ